MGNFDRYIVKTKELVLEKDGSKDTFVLHPLPMKFLPDLFEILRKMTSGGLDKTADMPEEEQIKSMMSILDRETITIALNLVYETMKISYPTEDDKTLQMFSKDNLWTIFPLVLEMNSLSPNSMETIKKADIMNKAKGGDSSAWKES